HLRFPRTDNPWARATFGAAAARSSTTATARSVRAGRSRRRSARARALEPADRPVLRSQCMEMKRLSGGNLRAAGYDERNRILRVELTSGTFEYSGVTLDMWKRFAGASSPWSFFRDNIDEEFPAKRVR